LGWDSNPLCLKKMRNKVISLLFQVIDQYKNESLPRLAESFHRTLRIIILDPAFEVS
jgi:hypothetical protein